MSRRDRRQGKRDKVKKKETRYTPPTTTERVIILTFGLALIIGSLYLALRNNKITENELSAVKVTLTADPELDQYSIKSTTYREIVFRTKEFKREFRITGMTYKSTDRSALSSEIRNGDMVVLKIMTTDIDELDNDTYFNNYNEVYDVIKGTKSYVSLINTEELSDNDGNWAFGFTALGIIFLPYGLMRTKPKISLERAVYALVFVGLIIILFIAYG